MISIPPPFALRVSKGERRVFQVPGRIVQQGRGYLKRLELFERFERWEQLYKKWRHDDAHHDLKSPG